MPKEPKASPVQAALLLTKDPAKDEEKTKLLTTALRLRWTRSNARTKVHSVLTSWNRADRRKRYS